MGSIQSGINALLGQVAGTTLLAKKVLSPKQPKATEQTKIPTNTQTPQEQARQVAEQNVANAIEAKKVQRQKLEQAWARGDFKNVSPKIQANIKAYLDKGEL